MGEGDRGGGASGDGVRGGWFLGCEWVMAQFGQAHITLSSLNFLYCATVSPEQDLWTQWSSTVHSKA